VLGRPVARAQSAGSPQDVRTGPTTANGRQRHTGRSDAVAVRSQRLPTTRGKFELYYDI